MPPISVTFEGGLSGILAPAVRQPTPIGLSNLDTEGLAVECAAVLVRTFAGNRLYVAASLGGMDSPRAGELGIGGNDDPLAAILWTESGGLILIDDGALSLGPYFAAGGDGNDLTLHVITATGAASQAVASVVSAKYPGDDTVAYFGRDPAAPFSDEMLARFREIKIGTRFLFALTRPNPEAPASAAFVGGLDGTLAPALALGSAPALELSATFVGGLDGTLAPALALGSYPALELSATFEGGLSGILAPAAARGPTPIGLSSLDTKGLDVECAAVLVRTAGGRVLYLDANHGGTDSPRAGELGIGGNDTPIVRMLWRGNRWLHLDDALGGDKSVPGSLSLGPYFAAGGDGNDLTLHVITATGAASQAVASVVSEDHPGTSNTAFFGRDAATPFSDEMLARFREIEVGTRFLFALTRPPVQASATFVGGLDGTLAPALALGSARALDLSATFAGGLDGTLAPALALRVSLPVSAAFVGGLDGTLAPALVIRPPVQASAAFVGGLDGTLAPALALRARLPVSAAFVGGLDGTLAPALALGSARALELSATFVGGLDGTLAPALVLSVAPALELSVGFVGGLDGTLAPRVALSTARALELSAGFAGGLDGTLAAAIAAGSLPVPELEFLGFAIAYPARVASDLDEEVNSARSLRVSGITRNAQRWRWRFDVLPLRSGIEWAEVFAHRSGAGLVGRFTIVVPQLVDVVGAGSATVSGVAGSRTLQLTVRGRLAIPVGRFVTIGTRGKVYQVGEAVDVAGGVSVVAVEVYPALVEGSADDALNLAPRATVEYADDGNFGLTIGTRGAARPRIEVVEALG